jgi:hypothetical protein
MSSVEQATRHSLSMHVLAWQLSFGHSRQTGGSGGQSTLVSQRIRPLGQIDVQVLPKHWRVAHDPSAQGSQISGAAQSSVVVHSSKHSARPGEQTPAASQVM